MPRGEGLTSCALEGPRTKGDIGTLSLGGVLGFLAVLCRHALMPVLADVVLVMRLRPHGFAAVRSGNRLRAWGASAEA